MEGDLQEGDLVIPTSASPAFHEKHGFGVILEVITSNVKNRKVTTYEVKFVKSLRTFRFGYDAVKRYE